MAQGPADRPAALVILHGSSATNRVHQGSDLDPIFEGRMLSSFTGQAVAVPVQVAFIGEGELFLGLYFASNDFKILKYNERGRVAERPLWAFGTWAEFDNVRVTRLVPVDEESD